LYSALQQTLAVCASFVHQFSVQVNVLT